jgi:hypothetical protein
MSFIWSNAEKFYRKDSLMAILANQLHRHYDRQYQRLKALRLGKRSRVVIGFKARLEALFDQNSDRNWSVHDFFRENVSDESQPFCEEELNIFIHHCQPELEFAKGENEIEVNDWASETLHTLRDFATSRLAEMNITYPS